MKKIILLTVFYSVVCCINAQTKATIYFDSNKCELKPNAIKDLDSLALVLKSGNNYEIQINGYCDNTGADTLNQILSEKRAMAAANYLKTKNINSNTKGFGASISAESNDDELGKAKNRRVEISITINNSVPDKPISKVIPTIEDKKTFNEKSTLTDLEVGKTLVLKNLNFQGGTAILLPEGKPTLEMLLKTMKDNPSLEIEIGGHVCCMDDMTLSILRAEYVYKYLIKNEINKSRITYKGYSRNRPIFEDDRDEYRARANRRVEIMITKK